MMKQHRFKICERDSEQDLLMLNIDGLAQDCSNSSADTLELL